VQNTEDAATDFTILLTADGPMGKLRSLTNRIIPFLAAE
jgi:hypothetical protein